MLQYRRLIRECIHKTYNILNEYQYTRKSTCIDVDEHTISYHDTENAEAYSLIGALLKSSHDCSVDENNNWLIDELGDQMDSNEMYVATISFLQGYLLAKGKCATVGYFGHHYCKNEILQILNNILANFGDDNGI